MFQKRAAPTPAQISGDKDHARPHIDGGGAEATNNAGLYESHAYQIPKGYKLVKKSNVLKRGTKILSYAAAASFAAASLYITAETIESVQQVDVHGLNYRETLNAKLEAAQWGAEGSVRAILSIIPSCDTITCVGNKDVIAEWVGAASAIIASNLFLQNERAHYAAERAVQDVVNDRPKAQPRPRQQRHHGHAT